jgi:hypothetical protein
MLQQKRINWSVKCFLIFDMFDNEPLSNASFAFILMKRN